jgi:hypothetical protein
MPLKAIRFTIAALIFATCAGAQTAAGLEFGSIG